VDYDKVFFVVIGVIDVIENLENQSSQSGSINISPPCHCDDAKELCHCEARSNRLLYRAA